MQSAQIIQQIMQMVMVPRQVLRVHKIRLNKLVKHP
jgi:hypothetical protein